MNREIRKQMRLLTDKEAAFGRREGGERRAGAAMRRESDISEQRQQDTGSLLFMSPQGLIGLFF